MCFVQMIRGVVWGKTVQDSRPETFLLYAEQLHHLLIGCIYV